MKIVFTLAACLLIFSNSANANISTQLIKSADGSWLVNYSSDQVIRKLGFGRNPDDARTLRWQPLDDAFVIQYIDNREYVVKKDSGSFTEVSFKLTPSYTHLPKDYAPFSPYSDGGTLIHSGRFFACANSCDDIQRWNLSLSVPDEEHIVFDGGLHTGSISWIDKNGGRNIYVGKQKPVNANGMLTLIDANLPEKVKLALDENIPGLMTYFSDKLGALEPGQVPMLFASYSNQRGHGSHVQGGTFTNQIFIHWDSDNLESEARNEDFTNDLLWTFAHEIAHFFQAYKGNSVYGMRSESWIHEGGAEYMASLALAQVYSSMAGFIEKKHEALTESCMSSLEKYSLKDAVENGDFLAHYRCGYLIHYAVAARLSDKKETAFTLWRRYQQQVINADKPYQNVFLDLVEDATDTEYALSLEQLIEQRLKEPDKAITLILKN